MATELSRTLFYAAPRGAPGLETQVAGGSEDAREVGSVMNGEPVAGESGDGPRTLLETLFGACPLNAFIDLKGVTPQAVRWWHVDAAAISLPTHLEPRAGEERYFRPFAHVRRGRKPKLEAIVPFAWVDIRTRSLPAWPATPTAVVRSEERVQAYWLYKRPVSDLGRAARVNRKLHLLSSLGNAEGGVSRILPLPHETCGISTHAEHQGPCLLEINTGALWNAVDLEDTIDGQFLITSAGGPGRRAPL